MSMKRWELLVYYITSKFVYNASSINLFCIIKHFWAMWPYRANHASFQVLHHTQDQRLSQLYKISHDIGGWLTEVMYCSVVWCDYSSQVLKAKMIYNTLDMCNYDMTQKCLVAECWCPVKSLGHIQEALRNGTVTSYCAWIMYYSYCSY